MSLTNKSIKWMVRQTDPGESLCFHCVLYPDCIHNKPSQRKYIGVPYRDSRIFNRHRGVIDCNEFAGTEQSIGTHWSARWR